MDSMASHNDQDHIHDKDYPSMEAPIAVDSERSPQLNKIIARGRQGCACAASRGGRQVPVDGGTQIVRADTASVAESDNGSSVNGEEGLDDHKVEVGDFGYVSVRVIYAALAKRLHCGCNCVRKDDYPFTASNSPAASGYPSGSSLIVEHDSGDEDSMNMSISSLAPSADGTGTRGTSLGGLVRHMGGPFEFDIVHTIPANNFIRTPIILGHEAQYCLNMDIGMGYRLFYPDHLSIVEGSSSGHSEYNMC